jgi:GNAT superfamily N-acetyltransferase
VEDAPVARVKVRDALPDDADALEGVRPGGALHRDRIRDADGRTMRYLMAEADGEPVAFACLVLGQPANWPQVRHTPQIIDLYVREDMRGLGIGTAFIREIEDRALAAGFTVLHIAADPEANPRACGLYGRLGYEPFYREPEPVSWEFVDSAGVRHGGVERVLHMVKVLGPLA